MPRTLHLSSRRCSADYVSRAHWPEGAISPFTSHRLAMDGEAPSTEGAPGNGLLHRCGTTLMKLFPPGT